MSDGEDFESLEQEEQGHDQDALDEQQGKGFGEDEGERDQALDDQ
jgi:hypothetical protein